jgi:SAM-dependent methyltransferase
MTFSWSEQYRRRRQAAERFGRIFDLAIVRRARDVLLKCVTPGMRVLEVGAGDRRMGRLLAEQRPGTVYQSLDPDPAGEHDYRDWGAISAANGPYDCVFAFEVVEHLPLEEIPEWLGRLAALLRPGGRLVLSTPNTFYPPAWLRDATHRTPLCYDELAGLVSATGLEVTRIVRTHNDPLPRRWLRRYAFGWLFRLIGIDFAPQIVVVAQKRPGAASGGEPVT